MIRTVLLSVTSLALLACGGSDGVVDTFNDFSNAQSQLVEKLCSCETDPAACETENGLTAAEESCIKDILAENDTPEVQAALDCQVDIANDLNACLNPITCDDQTTAAQDCFDAADAADEACPEFPAAVDAQIESTCFPG